MTLTPHAFTRTRSTQPGPRAHAHREGLPPGREDLCPSPRESCPGKVAAVSWERELQMARPVLPLVNLDDVTGRELASLGS